VKNNVGIHKTMKTLVVSDGVNYSTLRKKLVENIQLDEGRYEGHHSIL